MATIDELRGAPLGHTAKSNNTPKHLREAAIATATVMAVTPMAAQNQNNQRDSVDDGHKIEMVVQETTNRDNATTIDFYQAESEYTQSDIPIYAHVNELTERDDLQTFAVNTNRAYFSSNDNAIVCEVYHVSDEVAYAHTDSDKTFEQALKEFQSNLESMGYKGQMPQTLDDVNQILNNDLQGINKSEKEKLQMDAYNNGLQKAIYFKENIENVNRENTSKATIFHEKVHFHNNEVLEDALLPDKIVSKEYYFLLMAADEIEARIHGAQNIDEAIDKAVDDIIKDGYLDRYKRICDNGCDIGNATYNQLYVQNLEVDFLPSNQSYGYFERTFTDNSNGMSRVNFNNEQYFSYCDKENHPEGSVVTGVDGKQYEIGVVYDSNTGKPVLDESGKPLKAKLTQNTDVQTVGNRAVAVDNFSSRNFEEHLDSMFPDKSVRDKVSNILNRRIKTHQRYKAMENTSIREKTQTTFEQINNAKENTIDKERAQRYASMNNRTTDFNNGDYINITNLQQTNQAKDINSIIKDHSKSANNNQYTQMSKSGKLGATLGAAAIMAATPMAAQNQNTEREPIDDGHKIEMTVQESPNRDNAPTIDFYQAQSQAQSQALNPQDINVSYDQGTYVVEGSDGSIVMMEDESFRQSQIMRQARREHREHYSGSVDVQYVNLNSEEVIDGVVHGSLYLGRYDTRSNTITINSYKDNSNGEQYSPEQEQILNDVGSRLNDSNSQSSTLAHEQSHADDYNKPNFAICINRTQDQIRRANYDTEIKANIAEAALALEKFKQTGKIEEFDVIRNSGDLKEYKEWLQNNTDKADSKEGKLKLAQAIRNGWLERNNHEGTIYYNQAIQSIQNRDITGGGNVTAYASAGNLSPSAVAENRANINDYLRMQQDIFRDTALGDVSSVCCGYVQIGAGAANQDINNIDRAPTQAEQFVQSMSSNSSSVRGANRAIEQNLDVVRRADKDGVRTPEEQAQINQMVSNVCNSTKTMDQKTKDGITIARKTGRGWQNRSASKQDAGRTIENTNNNTNVAAMAAMQRGGRE